MIFATVGTHEQPFERLLTELDQIKQSTKEDIYIQSGFSEYRPLYCEYSSLMAFKEVENKIKEANIIITHGGPGSIMLALSYNKIPIVVPRQSKYNEHVDDHQVMFTKRMEIEKKVIAVYEIEELGEKIQNYNKYVKNLISLNSNSNLKNFTTKLEQTVRTLILKED